MRIELDFNSPEAIYIQLRNQIVMQIAQEQLRDGDSLPSVRCLAGELGVNMHTVNKAYAMLRQEGYLKITKDEMKQLIEEMYDTFLVIEEEE